MGRGHRNLAAALIVLAGCPKAAPVDYSEPPRLPAPTSGSYGRHVTTPGDPVVASVVAGRKWDAYLSGGATAVALDAAKAPVSLATWAIREDVWRAGYPYPIDSARLFDGAPEAPPPAEVIAWVSGVAPGADLGLVRARSAVRESWVGLVASPRVDLGVLPRVTRQGATLELPKVPGGRYVISEGDGDRLAGPLDSGWRGTFDVDGEWVVQVYDAQGLAAWFPIYVGIEAPHENLLPALPAPADTAEEVTALVAAYLADIRDAYGGAPWRRDAILDATARRMLGDPDATVGALLDGLGVTRPHHAWACTAPTVEACLDAIVWDPAQRRPFMAFEYTHLGVATAVDGPKVKIRIVLSGG